MRSDKVGKLRKGQVTPAWGKKFEFGATLKEKKKRL